MASLDRTCERLRDILRVHGRFKSGGAWAILLGVDLDKARAQFEKADAQRKELRLRIKKYTGVGVGGSARRQTCRSVGSSPTPPTIQRALHAKGRSK